MKKHIIAVTLILLALGAPAVAAQTGWVVSGTGPDLQVSLAALTTTPSSVEPAVPRLVLSCRDREAEVAFVMGRSVSPEQIRFDRDPPITPRFHHRTKFGSLLSSQRTVVDPETFYFDDLGVLKSLLSRRTLLLRGRTSAGVQDSVFELGGLDAQLPAFEQACAPKKPLPRPDAAPAAAAAPSAPPPPSTPPQEYGAWVAMESTSPMDDRPIVLASLGGQATPAVRGRSPALLLRCRGGLIEAMLDIGQPVFMAFNLGVQVSVDGGSSSEWWLTPARSGRSYFFYSGPLLLKRLLASKELHVALGPKKRRRGDEAMGRSSSRSTASTARPAASSRDVRSTSPR